jgi:excisionase family DNA binding protein
MDSEPRPDLDGAGVVRSGSRQLLLTPEQAALSLAICRTKVYELIATGQLDSVRIGSSRRIPVAALEEFVERLRSTAA